VKVDILVILTIDDNIEEYYWALQLLTNLQNILQATYEDSIDYIGYISSLDNHLKIVNKSIWMIQNLITNTPRYYTIELPYYLEYSADILELLHFIANVYSKYIGESSHFCNH
jgi:hypothetical protein